LKQRCAHSSKISRKVTLWRFEKGTCWQYPKP
jgi:uncharacterized membrane protein